jgi:histidine triad (HIT) family protein
MVLDEPEVLAFLDRAPLFLGHTLVIPRTHVVTIEDLPGPLLGPFFAAVGRVSRAVRSATGSVGSLVAMNNVVSQSVPHLHAHVVPRNRGDGLRGFFWPRQRYADDAERENVRAAIAAAL